MSGAKIVFSWIGLALVAFPLAGYAGLGIGGHVDGVGPALIGGAITGAGIGLVQWLFLRRDLNIGPGWILATSVAVLLSSNEARRGQLLYPAPYDGKQVYRNTKQANLLFAQELNRRCAKAGSPASAVAVHPGAASTNLFARQLERAGRGRLANVSKAVTSVLLPSAAAGARTTLRAIDDITPSGVFVAPAGFA